MHDEAVDIISRFYTEFLDYLVNPKIKYKNSICIYKGFIDGNIFEKLTNKHAGLFEKLKFDIGVLKNAKYPVSKKGKRFAADSFKYFSLKDLQNDLEIEKEIIAKRD